MREPQEWLDFELGDGVRLLLGWRSGRRGIEARPVSLRNEVAEEMVAACRDTLGTIARSQRRAYSGVPRLDMGEYLALDLPTEGADDRDALSDAGSLFGEDAAAASQLIQLVRSAFGNDDYLSREELQRGRWLSYAALLE